jgi:peptide/nickel transport system permease protein
MSLEQQFQPPNFSHLFGLDENGSDVLAKVLYGGQISISIALIVVLISLIIGLIIGSISGYIGGKVDSIVMRFIDMLYAFPNILLALALVAVLGPSIKNLIIAMCITSWTSYARLIRGEIIHLKEREYVTSSKALGLSPIKLVIYHIWPNLTGTLVVHCTFAMAGTIIAESGLSFLGLGAPPSQPTWGALLSSGRRYLAEAPHISLFPGIAILLLVLGFNLFGDGLRDYLDPKSKSY